MHGKKCGTITPATDSWKTKSIWLCGQFSPTVVNYGLICLHWSLIFLLTELWDPTLTNVSSGFQLALVKSHHADTGLTATFCISLSNRADQFSFQAHFPAEKQSDFSTAGTGMASLTDEAWSPKSQMPSAHAWVRQLHGTTFRRPASCTGAWACLKGKVKARTHTREPWDSMVYQISSIFSCLSCISSIFIFMVTRIRVMEYPSWKGPTNINESKPIESNKPLLTYIKLLIICVFVLIVLCFEKQSSLSNLVLPRWEMLTASPTLSLKIQPACSTWALESPAVSTDTHKDFLLDLFHSYEQCMKLQK